MFDALKIFIDHENLLTESEWNTLKNNFAKKEYHVDEIVTEEGQIEKYLYFILKGCVRKYYLVDGKEHCIDFRFENQFISSYASFLTQQPSRQFLQAIEETTLLAISYNSLQELYRISKSGEKLGRNNAEGLFIEKDLREASLMLDSPDERYINLMKQKPDWIQRLPLHMIASYLNVTPETLSRIRKRTK